MKYKSFDYYNPMTWIALGFGSGLSPVAPGTTGSFLAVCIYYFLINPFILEPIDFIFFLIFVFGSYVLGIFAHDKVVGKEKDPSYFVWDEFVGIWITCIPLFFIKNDFLYLFLSFLIFRFLDIFKPWPIIFFDQKEGSKGVMLDDVLAGLITIPASLLIFLLIS